MRLGLEKPADNKFEKEVFLRKFGKILDSDANLNNGDKVSLLLVASGLKPGALINIMWPPIFDQFAIAEGEIDQSKLDRTEFDMEIKALRRLIRESGISHSPIKVQERTDEHGVHIAEVNMEIASSDEILSDLSVAVRQKNHHRIGILLGYPKTAVDFLPMRLRKKGLNSRNRPSLNYRPPMNFFNLRRLPVIGEMN